jgi:hypothetical protein
VSEENHAKATSEPESLLTDPFESVPRSVAVERCIAAWINAYRTEAAKGTSSSISHKVANRNYCMAMPPLVGFENIRDFIACTTHGMLYGAVDPKEGTRLLYAAQVAAGTLRAQRKSEDD